MPGVHDNPCHDTTVQHLHLQEVFFLLWTLGTAMQLFMERVSREASNETCALPGMFFDYTTHSGAIDLFVSFSCWYLRYVCPTEIYSSVSCFAMTHLPPFCVGQLERAGTQAPINVLSIAVGVSGQHTVIQYLPNRISPTDRNWVGLQLLSRPEVDPKPPSPPPSCEDFVQE